jgi:hypothetical protein
MMSDKLNSIMTEMANGATAPVVEETPVIGEQPIEVVEVEDEEVEDLEVEETLGEEIEEPEEEVVVEDPEQGEDLDEIENWDDDIDDPETDDSKDDFDFTSIGNDLGIGDVKDKSEFVSKLKDKISSLEQNLNTLKESSVPDNIPDSLKEAIKVAQDGGDYEAYLQLNSIDYDMVSDIDLVANSVANYFSEDGVVDTEKLDSYLDDMSGDQLRIEAAKIRNSIKSQRQAQASEVARVASEKKERTLNSLKKSIDDLSDVNGFKPTASQKEYLWKAFYKDTVIKDLFYNERGEFDANKATKAVFQAKYGDKMDNFLKTKIRNQTKKEIINSMSSVEVQKPTSPAAPSVEKKEISAMDRMIMQLKGVKE